MNIALSWAFFFTNPQQPSLKKRQAFVNKQWRKGIGWKLFKKGGRRRGNMFPCPWKSIGSKFILYKVLFISKTALKLTSICKFRCIPFVFNVSLICHLPWTQATPKCLGRLSNRHPSQIKELSHSLASQRYICDFVHIFSLVNQN